MFRLGKYFTWLGWPAAGFALGLSAASPVGTLAAFAVLFYLRTPLNFRLMAVGYLLASFIGMFTANAPAGGVGSDSIWGEPGIDIFNDALRGMGVEPPWVNQVPPAVNPGPLYDPEIFSGLPSIPPPPPPGGGGYYPGMWRGVDA